jgi:hypothetical protein
MCPAALPAPAMAAAAAAGVQFAAAIPEGTTRVMLLVPL